MLVPVPNSPPPASADAAPTSRELRYDAGDAIPPGYRLREQPRMGLVIAGSIVTAVPWMFSIIAATDSNFDDKTGFLVVPAVGPWLMLLAGGASDRPCTSSSTVDFCSSSNSDRSGERALLVFDGLMQTAGATMFVLGMAFPRKRLVREDVSVSLVPAQLGRDGYGIGAVGTF
jgi:hypothetical protein